MASTFARYDKSKLANIAELAKKGLTDNEIAKSLHVSRSTFSRWKTKYPEVDEALRVNRVIPNANVEASLYKSAIGYHYEEEKWSKIDGEMVLVEKNVRYQHPMPAAYIFWLKNRMPEKWRDKVDVSSTNITATAKVSLKKLKDLSPDELVAKYRETLNKSE